MKNHWMEATQSLGRLAGLAMLLGCPLFAQAEDYLEELGLHGFALEAGEVLLPRLSPGAYSTSHRATLEIPDDGRYIFSIEVTGGTALLTLTPTDGEALSLLFKPDRSGLLAGLKSADWLDLKAGELQLELVFESDGSDRQRLRILWERELSDAGTFLPEPLPFDAWQPVDGLLRVDDMLDRVLLEQKGCTNCHLPSERSKQAVGQRRGPELGQVGSRLDKEWMRRWIADPEALQAGAHMPRLFGEHEQEQVAELVEFLASRIAPEFAAGEEESVATEPSVIDQGRQLYHSIGCVACHGALEPMSKVFQDPSYPSQLSSTRVAAPFGDLEGKWLPSALGEFLRNPALVYPDGRMPAMGLQDGEADLLATYLLSQWGAGRFRPAPAGGNAGARGAQLFVSKGCAACHGLEDLVSPAAKGLDQLQGRAGCLDEAHPSAPSYALDEAQRRSLERGIRAAAEASGAPAPLDQARRSLENLNCFACHSKSGTGGPAEELQPFFQVGDERVDLGDEGRLPPDLSGVGWKLTSTWLHGVLLEGKRARPYLQVRMPDYQAEHVAALPAALARMEGLWPHSDLESPDVSDAEVMQGREMMGREALSCVTCHSFRDLDPLGSPGPAFEQFGERLRYEWARSFLRAPQRFKPGSRMPDFYSGGKSTLHTVYEGDLGRQVDAMWAYFGLGEFMPPPPGMQAGSSLKLLVGETPRVMRAFLEGSGSRAIAVGNPQGVHYAFDAEQVRLSEVWQGDFLDASGSWAGRGGSTLGGMGAGIWAPGEGVPLQLFGRSSGRGNRQPPPGGAAGGLCFKGYRLDSQGDPTFLYDIRESRVEERLQVELLPTLKLQRLFRLQAAGLTGITLNALEVMKPRPRYRFDGGAWSVPTQLPLLDGRAYFHFVVPSGVTTIEIEMELQP